MILVLVPGVFIVSLMSDTVVPGMGKDQIGVTISAVMISSVKALV